MADQAPDYLIRTARHGTYGQPQTIDFMLLNPDARGTVTLTVRGGIIPKTTMRLGDDGSDHQLTLTPFRTPVVITCDSHGAMADPPPLSIPCYGGTNVDPRHVPEC